MRDFKFFEKETIDMMEGETYTTASFNDDTPEGHMNRRALYHTNRDLYGRLRQPNNEMEQYFNQRELRNLTELQRDLNDNPVRLFQTTTVTKVNPKWWMKIKIVLQESWLYNPIGVVVASALATIVTIIGIAKLLNAW
jgi:hypothetical protein